MSYYNLPTPDLLDAASTVATNAREADLLARLDSVGYGEPALAELDALIAETQAAQRTRETSLGNQIDATGSVEEDWEAFYDGTYMPHLGIARAVFRKNRRARSALGLDDARRRDKAGRYEQALQFYTNALDDADFTDALTARGVDATALQAGADGVRAIQAADFKQDDHRGLAQQSTRDRQKLERDLADWLSEFRDVVRAALKDRPEWLERLGIRHRS